MKTMRFLVAMAILAAVGAGLAGSACAAEKAGRKAATPAKKEKGAEKKAESAKTQSVKTKSDTKLEVGKKNDVRKNGGARKKSA